MNHSSGWRRLLRLPRSDIRRGVEDEIDAHLALLTADLVAQGLSLADARAQAEREFGAVGTIRDECIAIERRSRRRVNLTEAIMNILQDVRYTVRSLRANAVFATAAILCTGLGVGATATIFSAVYATLIRPLPFQQPDELVAVYAGIPAKNVTGVNISYPDYTSWRDESKSFTALGIWTWNSPSFTGAGVGGAERLEGAEVSPNLFPLMGVRPILGRTFLESEGVQGNDHVVILGYGLWQRRFSGDRDIVGRTVTINLEPYTVVGVMPRGFAFPDNGQAWMPFVPRRNELHGNRGYAGAIGRLKPGVTAQMAQRDLDVIMARLAREFPNENEGWRAEVVTMRDDLVGNLKRPLQVFSAAVVLVLLIACANVANLLLARASGRAREVAVRKALGASGWRLTRQLLTESVVLALGGAVIGVLLALWEVRLLKAVIPVPLPPWLSIEVSGRALLFTVLLAAVTGVIAGIVPALRLARGPVRESLATGVRGSGSARRSRTQRALVVVEVALAVVLLAGAGLLLTSLARLQAVPPGFSPEGVLVARLTPAGPRYQSLDAVIRFYDDVLNRLRDTPGVEAAGASGALPLSGSANTSNFHIVGRPQAAPGQDPTARWERVTSDYFRAIGIPLKAGRAFEARDKSDGPSVVVVSESWVRTFFPGETDVVGRLVRLGGSSIQSTIIGVVGDTRHDGLDEPVQPTMFLPFSQHPEGGMTIVVRTAGDPAAMTGVVREAVKSVDASIPVYDVSTMHDQVSKSLLAQRLSGSMIAVFALMALVLATVGVYGLIAYSVAERKHEIGIRLALGAQGRDLRRLVVGQGVRLTLAGVLIGLVGAVGVGRALRSLLFGVSATHAPTLAGVSIILIGVAVAASWIPARRAARTDLLGALRGD